MANLIQGYQLQIPFYLSGSEASGSFLFSNSGSVEVNTVATQTDYLVLKQNNQPVFKVNKEGVIEHKALPNTPTVVTGGLFYSASNGWYIYYD
jgi:hypothetical protein